MPANRGLLVEFVGLPASGKSRVARETASSLSTTLDDGDERVPAITTSSSKRSDADGIAAAGAPVGRQLVRSPRRAVAAARAIAASRQQQHRKAARFFLYHLYLCSELDQARRSGELHLADQGMLQHLRRVHLTATADGMSYLHALAATCYPPLDPALVVFVDVDHRTRMERAIERGNDIDEALLDPDHPAIQDDRESYNDIKELVPTLAAELGFSVRTMTIDNRDDNLDENVDRIRTAITDTLGADGGGRDDGRSASHRSPAEE